MHLILGRVREKRGNYARLSGRLAIAAAVLLLLLALNQSSVPVSAQSVSSQCGNGLCESGESPANCAQDCRTVRLTTNSAQQTTPSVGEKAIVWMDYRDGPADVYAYDFSSGSEKRLTYPAQIYCHNSQKNGGAPRACPTDLGNASNQRNPAISGTRVVYEEAAHYCWAGQYVAGWGECQDIYALDLATGNVTIVSSKPTNQQYPRIDGSKVTWFEAGDLTSGFSEVWWKDIITGVEGFVDYGSYPAISGSNIAYMKTDTATGGQAKEIGVFNTDTKQKESIQTSSDSQFPEISGNAVVYNDFDFANGGWQAVHYDLVSKQKKTLTSSADTKYRSPKVYGNTVVYTDTVKNSDSDLYSYDLSTGAENIVDRMAGSHELNPEIHDGKIVFTSNKYDFSDVFLYLIKPSSCGDGMCLSPAGESPSSCAQDCSSGSPNPPPPQQEPCGNGVCDNGETVATCFIDCRTGNASNSCSDIGPLPQALPAAASAQSGSEQAEQAREEGAQQPDELDVYYSGAKTETAENTTQQSIGYIVQFEEQPVAAEDSRIEADIATSQLKTEALKREIDGVNINGLAMIPGTIKKFTLNRQLSSYEKGLEYLKENKPAFVAQHRARLDTEHGQFRQNLRNRVVNADAKIKAEYETAFNGAALDVSKEEAEAIRKMPGVKEVFTDNLISIDLTTSVGYIKADSAWNLNDSYGNKVTGQGRTIAIIDTGVDYTHSDLGGCFGTQGTAGTASQAGQTQSVQAQARIALAQSVLSDGSQRNIAYVDDAMQNRLLFADELQLSGAASLPSLPQPEAGTSAANFGRNASLYKSYKVVAKPLGFDMNRNGKREVVLRRFTDIWTSAIDVYESGGGNYSPAYTLPIQQAGLDSYYQGDTGDSDSDNLSEIVIYGRTANNFSIRVYESTSPAAFPSQISWQIPDDWWAVGARIADTDKDGRKEIVVGGQSYNYAQRIVIYENTGNNAYSQTYYAAAPDLSTAQSVEIADDLDNDGRQEILFGGLTQPSGSKVYAYENTGNDAYQQSAAIELLEDDGQVINLNSIAYAGDMDGDGKKEFIAGGRKTVPYLGYPMFAVIYVFEAVSDNSFVKVANLSAPMPSIWDSASASVADVDGDGRNEILLSSGPNFRVFKSTGDNAFSELWGYNAADTLSVAGGDINGNGKQEVFFQDASSTAVYEYGAAGAPENCKVTGDEDGNGLADCSDTAACNEGVFCDSGNAKTCQNKQCLPVQSSPPQNVSCKVIGGYDFYNNDANPMDDHGHGTHVAATAAGSGTLKGVAPGAKIYAYKVCSSAGQCPYSSIIAAVNKALDPNGDGNLSDHVDVISMSLGGSGTPDDALSQAVDNAFDKGVFLSISAGNSGPSAQTIGCPGCARKATTVAAWCKPENAGTSGYCTSGPIASFSSRGPVVWPGGNLDKPDIAAPGVNICAAEWDSAWSGSRCVDSSHVAISGTSMAAPHISGAAALVKQAHPTWGPQQIKDALMKTAVDQGIDKYSQGAGLADVFAAITQSDTFPTAYLEVPGKLTGIIAVVGTAFGTNFTNYTLEYGAGGAPLEWAIISKSTTPVINGNLGNWNTLPLADGTYTLKLTVLNSIGESNRKTKIVEVNNVYLNSPKSGEIVSGKGIIRINGTATGSDFASYALEYGTGTSPSAWSSSGITLVDNGGMQKSNELLATWDASVVQSEGYYTLRLTVQYNGGGSTTEQTSIYIDQTLRKGWPVQLEPCTPGWCPTVVLNPTVADANNDGEMEILTSVAVYDANGLPVSYRHVFKGDGTVMPGWPILSTDHMNNGFVVSDINNDGTSELIINDDSTGKIYAPDGKLLASFYIPRNACIVTADTDKAFPGKEIIYSAGKKLVVLHKDGTTYLNMPLGSSATWPGCPAVGDVNNDGKTEIAALGNSEIYLYDEYGNTAPGWPKDTMETLSGFNSPVLGDLDGDGKLEILMGGNNGTLSAYRPDGTAITGFPLRIKTGYALSDPVVSDVDGDSAKEIVIRSSNSVYVLENNGATAAGWPVSMGSDYGSLVNPVIGDLDADGDKEIVVGRYAWHHNGAPVSGFPKKIQDTFLGLSSASALADLDGDGKTELVVGPTQFQHYIYAYDGEGNPAAVDGGMTKHDSAHTGNYNSAAWQAPARFAKYYYYTLSDSDCTVNLTQASLAGNQTLSAKYIPNACDEAWEQNISTAKGQSKSLIRSGLNKGSYALKLEGYGGYALTQNSVCLKDTTKPLISVSAVPPQLKGDLPLIATVSDTNGLKGCEACVSTDGTCDTEWRPEVVVKSFSYGDKQGACSFTFPGSGLADNRYTLNIRAEDLGANKAEGGPQSTTLDRTGPVAASVVIASAIETNSLITIAANLTDLSGVMNATALLGTSSAALKKNSLSGNYEGQLRTPQIAGNYNFTIASSDVAGNTATTSITVFVSQPLNWSRPVKAVTAQLNATKSEIASEPAGNVAVVWEDSSDGSPDIYYSRITPSAQLLTFAKKLTGTVYNSKKPSVHSAGDKTHIVWQDDRDGNNEIYYSQFVNGQAAISNLRVTFNSFDSTAPKVVSDGTLTHVFWIDNRDGGSSLYYAAIDGSGSKTAGDAKLADNVADYAVAAYAAAAAVQNSSMPPVRVAWASSGKAYHAAVSGAALQNVLMIGDATEVALGAAANSYLVAASNSGVTLYIVNPGSAIKPVAVASAASAGTSPTISVGQSGKANVMWNNPDAMFAAFDLSGNLIVAAKALGYGMKGRIAGDSNAIALLDSGTGELSIASTAALEKTAPVIEAASAAEVQRQTALVTVKTSEPTFAKVTYSQLGMQFNKSSAALSYNHSILIGDMQSSTAYSMQVTAEDVAGNRQTAAAALTTAAQKNRPALPTTFYGTAVETSGELMGGITATAHWTDTDGQSRTTTATTLANGSLYGHYIFNKANVNAKEGSTIRISAPDAVQDATLPAQPGSTPINVSQPVVVDKTPPAVFINSPQPGTYPTPFLTLNFTVSEPAAQASFALNNNAPVIVTGKEGQAINLTAKIGQNTLTVRATDMIGLTGQATAAFAVQDTVPPVVRANAVSYARNITTITANASDTTNSLAYCEACAGAGCVWQRAQSDFGTGSMQGRCTYSWNTNSLADGLHQVTFRAADEAGNIGTAEPALVKVDNTKPSAPPMAVEPVQKQNKVVVRWQQSSDSDFRRYVIYRVSSPAQAIATITNISQTEYTDTAVTSGGIYGYAVVVVDDAGNEAEPVFREVKASDTIPPAVTILQPQPKNYNTSAVLLDYSVSEATSWCGYRINSGQTTAATAGSAITAVEGNNLLALHCNDTSANQGSSSVQFSVDTTFPPSLNFTVSPVPGKNELAIAWAKSAATDFGHYTIYKSSAPFPSTKAATALIRIPVQSTLSYTDAAVSSQETYYYAVTAADKTGNEDTNAVGEAGNVADTIAPVLELHSPQQQLYRTAAVPLQYSANEPLGWCGYSINSNNAVQIPGNTTVIAAEGANTLTLYCNDTSQNKAEATAAFDVDAEIPANPAPAVSSIKGKNSLLINWSTSKPRDFGHFNIYRSGAPFSSLSDAAKAATTAASQHEDSGLQSETSYYYAVTATDIYGNENTTVRLASGTVSDTTPPPPLAATATAASMALSVTVRWIKSTASDFSSYNVYRSTAQFSSTGQAAKIAAISKLNDLTYTDTGVVSDTTYYYAATAADTSGNEASSVTTASARTYDFTPPAITILQPANTTYATKQLILDISVSEPAACSYSLNSGADQQINTTAAITANEGGNKASVSCSDANGNTGNSSIIFSTDTTAPPQVAISSVTPARGQNKLTVSWQPGAVQDLSGYRIYRSSSQFSSTTQAAMISTAAAAATNYTDNSVQSEATYHYAVTAYDKTGNENTSVTTKSGTAADTTAPFPVSGITVTAAPGKTELNLAWQPNAEKDISHYAIYRSSVPFSFALPELRIANTTAAAKAYNDTGLKSETTYYYAVTAADNSSNENKDVIAVGGTTPDIIAPNITISSPQQAATYNATTLLLNYAATEQVTCAYSLNSGPEQPPTQTITASEGQNTLALTCLDKASNKGNATVMFFADTTPPSPIAIAASQTPRKEIVVLSWQPSPEADFKEYIVYKSQSKFSSANELSVAATATIKQKSQTSYSDSLVKSQQTYYYAVSAGDSAGNMNTTLMPASITIEDLTPPQLLITSPESGKVYITKQIPLQYSASEPVSGCYYYLNSQFMAITANATTITALEGKNNLSLSCTDFNSNTGNSSVQFTADTEAPQPITGLIAVWAAAEGGVKLNWPSSAATDVKNYALYKSQSQFTDSGTALLAATTTGTQAKDNDVESEATYYYAVAAVDIRGNENTTVFSARITIPDTVPPAPVQNLTVSAVPKQTSLALSWQPSTENDFHHYTLYKSALPFTTAAASTAIATITDKNQANYTDSGLESSRTYHYAVTAADNSSNENKAVSPVAGTVADLTAPAVSVRQAASPAYGLVTLKASVSDNSLKQSCEACITQIPDLNGCEWKAATNSFAGKDKNGTCAYAWQAPNDGTTYFYSFRINDTSDNQAQGQTKQVTTLNTNEPIAFTIPLYKGWNLISFPLIPEDNSVNAAMRPVSGKFTRMFHYDSFTKSWQAHFAEQSIFNPEETLTTVETGKGYWIEMTENAELPITGTRVPGYSALLQQDWNMMGYPYEAAIGAEAALATIGNGYYAIFSYNSTHQKWERYSPYPSLSQPNSLTELQPGTGYMIDMKQEGTWAPQRP